MFNRLLWSFAFVLIYPISSYSADIEYVTVQVTGYGPSKPKAIEHGLTSALGQVNGQIISSSEMASISSVSEVDSKRVVKAGPSGTKAATKKVVLESTVEKLDQEVSSKTNGLIRSYSILELRSISSDEFEADLSATVAVLKKAKRSSRTSIAVYAQEFSHKGVTQNAIGEAFSEKLVNSRKFSVIDRTNSTALSQEKQRLLNSGNLEDMLRAQISEQPVSLLAILESKAQPWKNGRDIVNVSLRVVEADSRQIIYSDTQKMIVKDTDSSAKLNMKLGGLVSSIYKKLIKKIAQPRVLGLSNGQLTVSQGSDYFKIGNQVEILHSNSGLKDPYTGESLGPIQSVIAKGQVTFVNANISKVKVLSNLQRIVDLSSEENAFFNVQKLKTDSSSIKNSHKNKLDSLFD